MPRDDLGGRASVRGPRPPGLLQCHGQGLSDLRLHLGSAQFERPGHGVECGRGRSAVGHRSTIRTGEHPVDQPDGRSRFSRVGGTVPAKLTADDTPPLEPVDFSAAVADGVAQGITLKQITMDIGIHRTTLYDPRRGAHLLHSAGYLIIGYWCWATGRPE
jgi:hypothetical protein